VDYLAWHGEAGVREAGDAQRKSVGNEGEQEGCRVK
jgi:hypothetical protein